MNRDVVCTQRYPKTIIQTLLYLPRIYICFTEEKKTNSDLFFAVVEVKLATQSIQN